MKLAHLHDVNYQPLAYHLPSDHMSAQYRSIERLSKDIKPDLEAYKKSTHGWDNDFSADSLAYGKLGNVSRAGIDRMVNELKKE